MKRAYHLLLVNSVDEDRARLRALLEPINAKITEASSGLEAVGVLQTQHVDLVVTAIAIGEFDCWRLARFIRSGISQGSRLVPIVIVAREWCERITEITARDFEINCLLTFEQRDQLPEAVRSCLASPEEGLKNRSVLVIEDHLDNARLVEKILTPRFDVELAYDGQAGLNAWMSGRHDLVLLDMMLPKMSGESVLNGIMNTDPRQPVVMMTAYGTTDVAKQLMRLGAADFVTKPFRPDELRRVCELATRREDYLVSNAQVTERMDRLRHLQYQLANIVDSMPSALVGVDRNCVVNLWNKEAEIATQVDREVAEGQPLESVWPDFDHMDELRISLQHGEIRRLGKVRHTRNDKDCICDITIYPLYEENLVGAVIRLDDVTERILLEGRIVQSEKMVSMGHLAAGMAHEINNPLAAVMQNLQVISQRLTDTESTVNQNVAASSGIDLECLASYLSQREISACLDRVMDSGKRAAQLIENMLGFSQRDNSEMLLNDLAEVVDKSLALAASKFSLKDKFDFRSIQIERDFDPNMPLVECNSVQIQQVVFNLLINGAHAMMDKLRQCREAGTAEEYRPRFIVRTRQVDQQPVIEIEDNGSGMSDETRTRLFEPFYTTKNAGEGSGLGLSISHFIMTEIHHGSIRVDSVPEAGSRFVLEFPAMARA